MRSFFVMPLRISMRMPSLKPVFTLRRSYSFLDVDTYMNPLIIRSAAFIREKQYI